jgi:hypothetical protein
MGPLRRISIAAVVAGAALLATHTVAVPAAACPNCKDAIAENRDSAPPDAPAASGPPESGLSAGFNASILFMLAMPFLLLTGLGGAMALSLRPSHPAAEDSSA